AGAAATHMALGDRADAQLLIVFCSDAYDLEALAKGIASEAHDTPVVGCSTAGEIAASGPADASVVVTALGGPGFAVVTGVARDASPRLREAATEAVTATMQGLEERGHAVVLLLTDGLGGDQMEVIRGAYDVVGAQMPLVGGCAGDDLKMDATYQLFNGEVL